MSVATRLKFLPYDANFSWKIFFSHSAQPRVFQQLQLGFRVLHQRVAVRGERAETRILRVQNLRRQLHQRLQALAARLLDHLQLLVLRAVAAPRKRPARRRSPRRRRRAAGTRACPAPRSCAPGAAISFSNKRRSSCCMRSATARAASGTSPPGSAPSRESPRAARAEPWSPPRAPRAAPGRTARARRVRRRNRFNRDAAARVRQREAAHVLQAARDISARRAFC